MANRDGPLLSPYQDQRGVGFYDGSYTGYATAVTNPRAYFRQCSSLMTSPKQPGVHNMILRKFPLLVTGQGQTGLSPGFSYCWLRRNMLAACKA